MVEDSYGMIILLTLAGSRHSSLPLLCYRQWFVSAYLLTIFLNASSDIAECVYSFGTAVLAHP